MLHQDLMAIKPILARYAARYYLSGPEKDRLVEQTFLALAIDPDVVLDCPVERAVAETMHRVFAEQRRATQPA